MTTRTKMCKPVLLDHNGYGYSLLAWKTNSSFSRQQKLICFPITELLHSLGPSVNNNNSEITN